MDRPQTVMSESAAPLIELRDATKSYGAVHALRDANLALRPGEVRGLMGENGAGKSTLVKVLGGVVRRDTGDMLMDGRPVDFHAPHDARDAGIAVIYQEPTLFGDLSIAENVFMGYHPLGVDRPDRPARHAPRRSRACSTASACGSTPSARCAVSRSPTSRSSRSPRRCSFDARVLIMDEPTAALSGARGRAAVRRRAHAARAGRGDSVHLAPPRRGVRDLRHRVTVMRDGAVVHDARIADMTPDDMVAADGRPRAQRRCSRSRTPPTRRGAPERSTASPARACSSTSRFDVRAGEIVALAGLVGAGRSEVARAIFGIDQPDAGHVEIDGRRLPAGQPLAAMRAGIGFVPGGPPPAGARDGPLDRPQRDDDACCGSLTRFGLIGSRRGERGSPASGRRACSSSSTGSRTPVGVPVGRQPAEGRARASGWPPSPSC